MHRRHKENSDMLDLIIAPLLHQWATMVADRIQNRWGNLSGIRGNAEISAEFPLVAKGVLVQTIKAWGQRAWIAEYGSGSESDLSNPYLNEYTNASNFNHYRSKSDMTIRGRDAGAYQDLDGNPQKSTGSNAGKYLELKPVYPGMTMLPLHVIKEESEAAFPELVLAIEQAVTSEIANTLNIQLKIYI